MVNFKAVSVKLKFVTVKRTVVHKVYFILNELFLFCFVLK